MAKVPETEETKKNVFVADAPLTINAWKRIWKVYSVPQEQRPVNL